MKNFSPFVFLLFLLGSSIKYATAQHEYDIWYFGSNAGLDFTGGSPVNLTDGQVNTVEGNATISDNTGNLLFYTDGITVWNKLHNVMTNGNGLNGGESSTQSALILPLPGSDSLYYVFTVGQAFTNGLQYSIVDMSLQSGNGEVIAKNILLLSNTTEKLTAARDSNNIDYWIVTHQSGNKKFDAFKFTALGISSTPVISTLGSTHNSEIGYMKCSHNGSKIAVAVHSDFFFELFDFNNATGVVSNPIHLTPPPSSLGPYGLEFAPNDSLLYGTVYTPGIIAQWDISSNDEATINASLNTDTSANVYAFGLQLAPDGKIYVAKYLDDHLGVINNPNVYGSGYDFIDEGFNLSPKQSQGGLPNIFPGFFVQSNLPPVAQFLESNSSFCINTCISFTDQSINNPTSWNWQFPGGTPSSSTSQNPTNICYFNAGTYDVTLIVTNDAGTDTIVMSNLLTVAPLPTATITQSNDTLYSSSGTSYQWYSGGNSIAGATNSFYVPSQEDFYSVVITDSTGCLAADTIFFTLGPLSNFSVPDPTICQKFCTDYFDQSTNNPVTWLWQFEGGSPASSSQQNPVGICYNTPGIYDVTLITTNANGTDTLTLQDFITVYSTPPFPAITQVGYTLTSSPASSYQWQFNSVDIPGATNQSYTVMQSGLYTVIIRDSNGCQNSASLKVFLSGIEEVTGDASISVYPNPSSGSFTVECLPSGQAGINNQLVGQLSIDVVNTLGQIVFTSQESRSTGTADLKMEIDLGSVSRGVYFIEIKTENVFVMKKIVIAD